MSGWEVAVVRTGVANLASVMAGLRRAGAHPTVCESASEVAVSDRLVLPGVGAFGAGMSRLEAAGLGEALRTRMEAGRPTLGICLGMQLVCEGSEESPGTEGLGLVPGTTLRFPPSVPVPQLGWNRVESSEGCRYLRRGYAYFANSFRLVDAPPGFAPAWSDHGGPFVAALERGRLLLCQFHPELSGAWGIDLLRRWLGSEEEDRC